jgi:antibiotic biosynthesis monooxygenase (ABM) superfamily enzyme
MNTASPAKPPRWKAICVSMAVVYPLLLLTRVVAPQLDWLPPWLRDMVMVAMMCTMISFAVPALSQRLQGWLYAQDRP